jgi:hypothetical protein
LNFFGFGEEESDEISDSSSIHDERSNASGNEKYPPVSKSQNGFEEEGLPLTIFDTVICDAIVLESHHTKNDNRWESLKSQKLLCFDFGSAYLTGVCIRSVQDFGRLKKSID